MKQIRSPESSSLKPVFWLGAGCSVYDGVPLNNDLLRQVLPASASSWGSAQFQFDQFCDTLGPGSTRLALLQPYMIRPLRIDSPYHGLVRLCQEGYVDLIFTFNIDNLLEQAFTAAGYREQRDYILIKVPETRSEVVRQQVTALGPRLRVIKLHGDLQWGFNYMTSAEIARFDERIAALVREYSQRVGVVCGYSFFHLNVLNSFSHQGGPLFYVNRSFPDTPMVLSLMATRSQSPLFIDEALGCFEHFIPQLLQALI
jgi:hypothetical protein